MPVKYSKIENEKIIVEPLVKGGERYSDILYQDTPLIIQTPYSFQLNENNMSFSLVKKGKFYNIYDNIFDTVCQRISDLEAYQGKFTPQKVKQKISQKPIEVNEEGDGVLFLKNKGDSIVKVYDYLMEECREETFDSLKGTQGSALLHIKRILYTKTNISFEVILVGLRIDSPKVEHIHQDILEESQDEILEEIVNEGLSDEDDLVLDEPPQLTSTMPSDEDDFFFD